MANEKLHDQNDVSSKPKRYAWVAVLLALILSPFFSMLYLGKGRRGFAYLGLSVLAIVAPPFLASAGFWPTFVDMSFLGYAVRILGAVDAYRIAQRNRQVSLGTCHIPTQFVPLAFCFQLHRSLACHIGNVLLPFR